MQENMVQKKKQAVSRNVVFDSDKHSTCINQDEKTRDVVLDLPKYRKDDRKNFTVNIPCNKPINFSCTDKLHRITIPDGNNRGPTLNDLMPRKRSKSSGMRSSRTRKETENFGLYERAPRAKSHASKPRKCSKPRKSHCAKAARKPRCAKASRKPRCAKASRKPRCAKASRKPRCAKAKSSRASKGRSSKCGRKNSRAVQACKPRAVRAKSLGLRGKSRIGRPKKCASPIETRSASKKQGLAETEGRRQRSKSTKHSVAGKKRSANKSIEKRISSVKSRSGSRAAKRRHSSVRKSSKRRATASKKEKDDGEPPRKRGRPRKNEKGESR